MAMITQSQLAALYTLDAIGGFGPVKFRELYKAEIEPEDVIQNPEIVPLKGVTRDKIISQILSLETSTIEDCKMRAERYLEKAVNSKAEIITYKHKLYPKNVFNSNNPVPVLYATGDLKVLTHDKTVAVVGSRKTKEPYSDRIVDFTKFACSEGFAIVAGFALGADSIGHVAAKDNNGSTICVMPCGVDLVFPPENRDLWRKWNAESGAVFISEFGFGVRASALQLRKRNKLIVAFSRGVLVAQSAKDGGAMNAYRFGREQKKPIATFEDDLSSATSGNRLISDDSENGLTEVFQTTVSRSSDYHSWLSRL